MHAPAHKLYHIKYTQSTTTSRSIHELFACYHSPLIISIDGSCIDATTEPSPIPAQSSMALVPRTVASAVVISVNNISVSPSLATFPTIFHLACVKPLPESFDTNAPTNNSVELVARNIALGMIPPYTPVINVYDSANVHNRQLSLLSIH